jgi:hypothetical protein
MLFAHGVPDFLQPHTAIAVGGKTSECARAEISMSGAKKCREFSALGFSIVYAHCV